MRVISVVGARPQFVKLAPITSALAAAGHEHYIVHTGQHYDAAMSASFFDHLAIPQPDYNLEVGSASHGEQTGAILAGLEAVFLREESDWVLVYGDTNSTVAGALAATKLHKRVAHLEAGLRSFNRRMPEELNRVATDHLSDLLLAPTEQALQNLFSEGLSARARITGDVMADICYAVRDRIGSVAPPLSVSPGEPFVLATLHRPDNTDVSERLRSLISELDSCLCRVVLLAHPRLQSRLAEFRISPGPNVIVRPPLSYPEMVAALGLAKGVITDSGGLQKEAYLMGVPCTTVRSETEWVETLTHGWNVLDPDAGNLSSLAVRDRPQTGPLPIYGNGNAADLAVRVMNELA